MDHRYKPDSAHLSFGGMCWPDPADPWDVGWKLRHGSDAEKASGAAVAQSYIAAYAYLVAMPRRLREQRIRELRAEMTRKREMVGEPE